MYEAHSRIPFQEFKARDECEVTFDIMSDFKFLTNHALVLSWISRHPDTTARQMARAVGITERTVLKIVGELEEGGYIDRRRRGRRNVYQVDVDISLRHHQERKIQVGELLALIAPKRRRGAA